MKLNKLLFFCMFLTLGLPISANSLKVSSNPQTRMMTSIDGKVFSQSGEPLPGVSVTIKGTSIGTTTDMNGHFSLQAEAGKDKLVFSYIGFVSLEKEIEPKMKIILKEDVQALGEVVVTTQKKHQNSIDVPVAISAMNSTSLSQLNIKQFDEMAQYIPGLQIQLQSPNTPGYVIRGVTSDGGASYSQPRVSIFQDGISISRSPVVELFDLERVEVVKGPQGTLFGRGAEIGAVHVIRHKAVNALSGELSLNYGTHNQRSASGFLNTPLLKDKIFNRFAFSYDAHDGYIKNLSGGRLNGKSAIALRNSTRFLFNDKTTADLILDYQHDDYPGTEFKSKRYAPIGGDTDPNTFADLEQGKNLYIKRDLGGATFLLDHSFNDYFKFSSITGGRAFKSDESFDADGTCAPIIWAFEKEKGCQFSQEFRLNYDSKKWFSGFAGVSYFYENSRQQVITNVNEQYLYPAFASSKMKDTFSSMLPKSDATNQLLNLIFPKQEVIVNGKAVPVTNLPNIRKTIEQAMSAQYNMPLTLENIVAMMMPDKSDAEKAAIIGMVDAYSNKKLDPNYKEESTNYGINQAAEIFADGTFKLTKGLSLTVGVRGSYENQKSQYQSSTVPGTFGVMLYTPSKGRLSYSDSYKSWVGRAVLNYMIGRNNIYASISKGRRPAVISVDANVDGTEKVTQLNPEIITSYEFGVKGMTPNGRFNYDLCTYYYKWNHFQTISLQDDVTTLGKKTVPSDAGRAHTFGVEANMQYVIVRPITLFANYSYIDGKFDKTDDNGMSQEYAGNRFRLTPMNTFSAGLNAHFVVNNRNVIFIRPSYCYKSRVHFEDNNRADLIQGGYGIVNFNAGYRINKENNFYELSLFGKNALNKKYIIDAGNSGDNIGFPTFIAGAPSVFGVQFKIGF